MREILVATFALLLFQATASKAAIKQVEGVFVGVDGRNFSLQDNRGKWVLVNYYATWCASCIKEMPALSKLASDSSGLIVVGVTDERLSPEKLRMFNKSHPASYSTIEVLPASVPRDLPDTFFGMNSRPISYLIRPNGTVARRFIGEANVLAIKAIMATP